MAVHRGDRAAAAVQLAAADRLLPQLTHALPWLAVPTRLELTRVELAMGGNEAAAAHMKEVRELLRRRPDLGLLVQRVRELEQQLPALADGVSGGRAPSPGRSCGCCRC